MLVLIQMIYNDIEFIHPELLTVSKEGAGIVLLDIFCHLKC